MSKRRGGRHLLQSDQGRDDALCRAEGVGHLRQPHPKAEAGPGRPAHPLGCLPQGPDRRCTHSKQSSAWELSSTGDVLVLMVMAGSLCGWTIGIYQSQATDARHLSEGRLDSSSACAGSDAAELGFALHRHFAVRPISIQAEIPCQTTQYEPSSLGLHCHTLPAVRRKVCFTWSAAVCRQAIADACKAGQSVQRHLPQHT